MVAGEPPVAALWVAVEPAYASRVSAFDEPGLLRSMACTDGHSVLAGQARNRPMKRVGRVVGKLVARTVWGGKRRWLDCVADEELRVLACHEPTKLNRHDRLKRPNPDLKEAHVIITIFH